MATNRNTEQLCQRLDQALAKAATVLGRKPADLEKGTSFGDYDRPTRLRTALAKADAALAKADRLVTDTASRIAELQQEVERLKALDQLQVMSRPTRPPFLLQKAQQ